MLFPTFDFLLFFLVVFTIAWAIKDYENSHKFFLIGASYFFYGFWDWRFIFLLLGSSVMNYTAGRFLDAASSEKIRKWIVGVAVGLNISLLCFFKYYGFFIESLADLLRVLGWQRDLPFLEIILPIGISFFTFQGISYVVDVYRRETPSKRPFLNVVLYISFFPHLVAGPIVRAAYFLPQLEKKPEADRVLAGMGILLIVWGVFKKAIIANYLAVEMVDKVFFDPTLYGPVDLVLALYGYSIQLFCDFSAYSDIATGVAALLGYRFTRNFDQPWRSRTVGEFWQRWHLSLSTWLRDYLYIPLGGSRKGRARTFRNLFITMFLGGIWHGAGYTFVLWSLYQGLALAGERLMQTIRPPRPMGIWRKALNTFFIFNLLSASWLLFRAPSMEITGQMVASFSQWKAPIQHLNVFMVSLILFGLVSNFWPSDMLRRVETRFTRLPWLVQGLLAGLALVAIEAFGTEGVAPFIYFQF